MKVAIDLDSTVADLLTPWLSKINARWPEHPKLKISDLKTFDIASHHPAGEEVYKLLDSPGLFLDLKPLPGALDALKESFDRGDSQYILTDVVGSGDVIDRHKRTWVDEYIPWIKPSRVFTFRGKELRKSHIVDALDMDVVIEDGPHHVEAIWNIENSPPILCIGYEYNRHVEDKCYGYVRIEEHEYNYERAWKRFTKYMNEIREELRDAK